VQFRNAGTATLTGIVVSDQPWIVPNPQPISIEPGSIGTVTFRVIRSRRPEGAEGALVANLSLVYVDGSAGFANIQELGATSPGVSVSKVSVVDVTKPPIAPGFAPPLGAGEVALFIPGVVNRDNVRSDVSIANAIGGSTINDLKAYFTNGSATSVASLLPLSASKAVSLVNVGNIFGATNAAGTMQLRTNNWQSIGADAKITAVKPEGTMSGSVPVFRGDRATPAGQRIFLPGITRPGDIVVQETNGVATKVRIEFVDANGGNTSQIDRDIPARSMLELRDVVPAGAVTAIVSNLTASSGILAYARAGDAASGDAWSIVDWSALYRFSRTDAVRLPFVDGKAAATGGRRRSAPHATTKQGRTDVTLFNTSAAEARVKVQAIDTAGNVTEKDVVVGPRHTVLVPGAGGSASSTTAHLVLQPLKGEVAVTARSFVSAGSGTVGTAIPVLAATAGLRLGQSQVFSSLEDSTSATVNAKTPATFRTSYGFVETSGAAVRVRARILIDEAHALVTAVTSRTFDLAPRQQIVLPELLRSFAGDARDTAYSDLHDLTLEIEVIQGSGSVVPFLIVTDNGTGDFVLKVQ